jgi:Spy/CpxP family protein refolding chaperone
MPLALCIYQKITISKGDIKMKKLMTFALSLLLVTALAVSAEAYRGGGRGYGNGPCYGGDLGNVPGLNLTAEQKAKIADMRVAHQKEMKPLQDQMFSKKGDLRLLWQEKNPDQAKITAKQKEIRALRDQIEDKATNYRWAVYKELTPEQQESLRAYGPTGRCFEPCFGPGAGSGPGKGPGGGRGPGSGPGPGPRGNW